MLKVEGLEYRYKKSNFALKSIDFSLEDGYLMCLIGPNGAGKTTLLQGIYGVLNLECGKVTYNNIPVVAGKNKGSMETNQLNKISSKVLADYHQEVAYVGLISWYIRDLSMAENVQVLKTFYKKFDDKEYERLLDYLGLTKADCEKKYIELSAGQKMLFQLAFAMARHPKLLLLDEPFANLDPVVKVDLAQLFQDKLQQENLQIILSTHLVDDISDMVDYIGILRNGEMVQFGDRESIFEGKSVEGLRELILKGTHKESE